MLRGRSQKYAFTVHIAFREHSYFSVFDAPPNRSRFLAFRNAMIDMDIKKAIQQTRPFKSPYQKAMVNMMYTHGWLLDQQKKFFSPFGITSKQYNILRILAGAKKPLTTSQIRERMLDKMSDITRLINRMIKKGWVQKEICSTDRRLVDIVITDLGNQLLDQIEIHVS
ncbi:MAG: MarR family transcriptional regulator, partial [Bacteroidota bacterium]